MVALLHAVVRAAYPVASAGSYSFTMTAGDSGVGVLGYNSDEDLIEVGPFGSINAEPVPGADLLLLISGLSAIFFSGNQVALLAGKTVWVDGVEYPFDGSDWAYDEGGFTGGEWVTGGPTFVNAGVYFVEIK